MKIPPEVYRAADFIMLDTDIVAVSPASVWRVLSRAGLLRKWNPWRRHAAALRFQFRSKFPKVSNCTGQDNPEKPWQYRDADIKLVKFYSSKQAWSVVQLQLVGYRCDGPPEENAFVDQWFTAQHLLSPVNGELRSPPR